MKYRKISIEESKKIQLEMLIEIDAFCRENGIKYALSCGTLIGAVRHNGYIPWDDDVDITMLYSDILKFRKLFKSEKMEYVDVDNFKGHHLHFPRIVLKKSFTPDGLIRKGPGICIDLYPIIESVNITEDLYLKGIKKFQKRKRMIRYRRIICKFLPIHNIPYFNSFMKKYRDFFLNELQTEGTGMFYQMGGPLKMFSKNIWPFNPLDEVIDKDFEGHMFLIPKRYDEFLTIRYGDYMNLPPEDQRHPYHKRNCYIIEN